MESAGQIRKTLDLVLGSVDFPIVASLPQNSLDFAAQAQAAGTDGIILNVDHDEASSPVHFGSFDLQEESIKDVLANVSSPAGIFIGGAKPLTKENWERIVTNPFSFVGMYAHHMPLFVLQDNRIQKILAIGSGYILEQVKNLSEMDGVIALEAAIVPAQAKAYPFNALDLSTLAVISKLSSKPVLLRTQKKLSITDIPQIREAGIKGLVIDPSSLQATRETYTEELRSISPRGKQPEQEIQ
jgi:hypothetical protein